MEELLAQGASRVVAWERETAAATVLFSSFSPAPTDGELSALEALFEDREAAIRSGMVLEGKRFEVKNERVKKERKGKKKKNSSVDFFFQRAQPKQTKKKHEKKNRSTATTRRWSTAERWARSPRRLRGLPCAASKGEKEEKRQRRKRRARRKSEDEQRRRRRRRRRRRQRRRSPSPRYLTGSRTSPRGWCRCWKGFASRSFVEEGEGEEEEEGGARRRRRRLLLPQAEEEARPEGEGEPFSPPSLFYFFKPPASTKKSVEVEIAL